MKKQEEEIPDEIAWATLLQCNENLGARLNQSEAKIERIMKVIESELKEIPKLQDFASGHGDAQGYARVCGQEVLLRRLYEKFKVIVQNECDCISKENESLRETIENLRELLIDAEKRGEMKAIVCKYRRENDSELRLMVLDFAYWLEVNSSEMTPYDPDRAVENYMKYLDKSLAGI